MEAKFVGHTPSWKAGANRLAHALQRHGCRAGATTLLWCGKNSPNVVVLGHASRKCGLTAVPLNYRLTR